jgi:succinoglycan biosynthesis protein ExoH
MGLANTILIEQKSMSETDLTEKRIDLLRSLMIFGVVVLHTPPYVPIAQVGTTSFDLMVAFFQHAVFRTTVPVLTFISGYLLFRSSLDLQPIQLLQKKSRSILIPFLFFNLTLVALFVLLREGAGVTIGSTRLENTEDWLNATLGLTGEPLNYPLNFLRDLIALFIAAPLLGWFLRKAPWLGLGLLALVFYFELDGLYLLRDAMAPVFYLGGMAAILKWDMRGLDRYAAPLLVVFLGLCAGIVHFRVINTSYLQLAAPLFIWPAASLLVPTSVGAWLGKMSKYSYFLFLAHAPVLIAVAMIYKMFSQFIPFPFYWIVTPVIVTSIVIAVYNFCMRVSPKSFNAVIGNNYRRARAAQAPILERRKAPRPAGAPVYSPELRMALAQH